jgi:hypothetical protein
MRRIVTVGIALSAVFGLSLGGCALPNADVKIPITFLADMVLDPVHGHIFMSGGPGANSIVVTDMNGGNLRTIDNVGPNAWGMTLSSDSSTLYVAASGAHEIWIVNTTTLEVEGAYWSAVSDGGPTCPRYLAETPGQLWFSWGCGFGDTSLGRILLDTGQFDLFTVAYPEIPDHFCHPPDLATVPSRPDMLLVGQRCSGFGVLRFRIALGGPQELDLFREAVGPAGGGGVAQMAVSPDGSQLLAPAAVPYYHQLLQTSDLTEVHRYPTDTYPSAAAIRDDGLVVAGLSSSLGTDVYVFEPGGSTPIRTYDFGTARAPDNTEYPHELVRGGLAVDGVRFFAITQNTLEPNNLTLRIRNL